jgi:hypothetical protein
MKLTLRELFLLVALVAMGCGWWVDHSRLSHWCKVMHETMRREAPWLVESDMPDWATNLMRQEAQARREALEAPKSLTPQSPYEPKDFQSPPLSSDENGN